MPRYIVAPALPRQSRHARLFALYRHEHLDSEDPREPVSREAPLIEEQATRLKQAAIASLSREIPWPQRIFQKNRSGSPVV